MKKPLDPALLRDAAEEIAGLADQASVQVALVGGFALQYLGSDRLTGNIDVVSPILLLRDAQSISFGGQRALSSNGVSVDIIVRTDDYAGLYEESLMYVRDVGAPLPVVEPLYIAAMKLVAGRRKDDDDLDFLISSKTIDVEKTRRLIKRLLGAYAAKEFKSFADESIWRAHQAGD